jgi:hypothetical protein
MVARMCMGTVCVCVCLYMLQSLCVCVLFLCCVCVGAGPLVTEMRQRFGPAHRQRWQLAEGATVATITHTVGPLQENREVRAHIHTFSYTQAYTDTHRHTYRQGNHVIVYVDGWLTSAACAGWRPCVSVCVDLCFLFLFLSVSPTHSLTRLHTLFLSVFQ